MADTDQSEDAALNHSSFRAPKRRRIEFVPQSAPTDALPALAPSLNTAQDLYLAIIRPQNFPPAASTLSTYEPPSLCSTCHTDPHTTTSPHESSIVHQLSLPHSHPVSSIDRHRKGFAYLSAQGWDPDATEGRGLGAHGEGRLYPVRAKAGVAKEGIGVEHSEGERENVGKGKVGKVGKVGKGKGKKGGEAEAEMLNAKKMKKLEIEQKKRGERVQRLFTGNDEVNRYLGVEL